MELVSSKLTTSKWVKYRKKAYAAYLSALLSESGFSYPKKNKKTDQILSTLPILPVSNIQLFYLFLAILGYCNRNVAFFEISLCKSTTSFEQNIRSMIHKQNTGNVALNCIAGHMLAYYYVILLDSNCL